MEAAVAAGMHPIAVTNTYRRDELEGKAMHVVNRLDEITIDMMNQYCAQ